MDQGLVKVAKSTIIGKNVKFEDFVIIGDRTQIGANSHIRSHTVIYKNNKIGTNFKTGHGVLIRENNTIGDNVVIGSHSIVEHHVKIGKNSRLHSAVFVPEFTIIESDCFIGPQVTLTNAKYPLSKPAKKKLKGPIIKKGAKIGAGSVILPQVTIGQNALIGAGSVVTRNVPAGDVVVGNPARKLKRLTDILDYG